MPEKRKLKTSSIQVLRDCSRRSLQLMRWFLINLMNSKNQLKENHSNRRNLLNIPKNPRSRKANNLKSLRAQNSRRNPKQKRKKTKKNRSKINNRKNLKRARNHNSQMMDTKVRMQTSLKTRNLRIIALLCHRLKMKQILIPSR